MTHIRIQTMTKIQHKEEQTIAEETRVRL